jgi:hypothetical protein
LSAADGAGVLHLDGSPRDLAVFAERAARHDPGTPVRLVAAGTTLAAFVSTSFECLGLRATRLRQPADLDLLVEAVGLGARARAAVNGRLTLPPRLPDLLWTSPLPPRSGWAEVGRLDVAEVAARVEDDTAEFTREAQQVPAGRGANAALEGIAADLWARPLLGSAPSRLAHTAHYLGFLPDFGEAVVRASGPWHRLDTSAGVTLARVGGPLGLFVS